MEKFLLSFLMSLLLLLPARVSATPTEVSFASGVPSDWTKFGTCAVQNSGTYKGSTQLQTNAYVQSPAITGINSLKIKLTRSGGGTDFTISYSYDKSEWNELAKYTSSTVNSGGTFQEQEIPSSAISAIDASKPVYLKFHSTKASYFISTITYEIGGGGGDVLAAPTFTVNGTAVSGTTATVYAGDKVEAACSTSGATVTLQLNNSAVSNPYTITEAAGTVLNFEAVAEKAGAEPTSTSANLTVTVAKTPVITDALTDEIIFSNFLTSAGKPVSGGNTTYGDYSFTSSITGITYKANMATGNNSIQLRSKNSNSGIVTTENPQGYTLSSIEIEWNSNTAKDNILKILGDNSKYTAATDLYATSSNNNQAKGEELGSITNGTSTSCTLNDLTKTFIGLRSSNGAIYINKITLKWAKATQKEPTKVTLGWSETYPETGLDLYVGESKTVTAVVKDATDPTKVYSDAKVNYASGNDDIVSIEGTNLKGNSANNTTITAMLADGQDYVYAEGAKAIELNVNVKKSDMTLSKVTNAPSEMAINGTLNFIELVDAKVTGFSGVLDAAKSAMTCSAVSGADLVEINGDMITAKKAGEVTLKFSIPEGAQYNASNELEVSLTVTKAEPELYYDPTEFVYYLHGDNSTPVQFPVLHAIPTDLPIKYEIVYTGTKKDIATVDENGEVEPKHIGTATVKASFAGNDIYEPKTAEYSLKVEIEEVQPPIKETSFTIEFTKGSTKDGTVVTETTPIVDVFSKGYDKLVESYPYYIANTNDAYVSTEKGLLFNQTTVDKEGKYGNYINLYLDKAYDVTDVEFNLSLYDSNDTPMVYFNSSNQGQEINSDGVQKVSLNESRDMIYFMAGGSSVDDGRIYIQDVTVHYTEADENAATLAVPALYDENDNLIPKATESIQDSDFILVEHQPGVTIHYEYVAGSNSGNESDKPLQSAPARVAQNETSDMHDNVSTDDRSAIKIYPYGKKSEGYNHWTDGTITVYAEDANGNRSATRTINIGTPTSVEGIEAEGNGEVEYFNLQGVKVQNPEKGIYIRVQDGKAVKIVK